MLIIDNKEYFNKKEAMEKFGISDVYLKTWKKYGLKSYIIEDIEYYTNADKIEFELLPHFYVYIYFDSSKSGNYTYGEFKFDYEPFYVGKGKFDRFSAHLNANSKTYNQHKTNKINKLKREGKEIIIEKYFINLFEDDAFKKEELLIKTIGIGHDNGPLTNLTYGGIGGTQSTRDTRIRMGHAQKERLKRDGHPMQGKKHSPETCEKMRNKIRPKWDKEQKDNLKKVRCANKNKSQTLTWKCIDPEGNEFIVYGLGEFSRNNNLIQSHMCSVARGTRKHHKGWKCEYYESKG